MAAVCHHGGAGTTAAGLRAGKPTIVVPFFGDQFFWGAMINKRGAGPVPISGKSITATQLAEAFTFVHEPKTIAAAADISTRMELEDGCERAVRSFHAHLPLARMHSDLEPSFGACYRLNDYDLQISRPVAQVLVAAGAIEESDLSAQHTYGWSSLRHESRFKVFTRGFRERVSKLTHSVERSKRSSSISHPETYVSRRRSTMTDLEVARVEQPFKDCVPLYGDVKERTEKPSSGDTRRESQLKHSVRYGLAGLLVKAPLGNRRHSVASTGASPAVNSPHKNIAPLRAPPILSRHASHGTRRSSMQHDSTTGVKHRSSSKPKDKSHHRSAVQRAADLSGYSVDVCNTILAEFSTVKSDRDPPTGDDKAKQRSKPLFGSHRSVLPH